MSKAKHNQVATARAAYASKLHTLELREAELKAKLTRLEETVDFAVEERTTKLQLEIDELQNSLEDALDDLVRAGHNARVLQSEIDDQMRRVEHFRTLAQNEGNLADGFEKRTLFYRRWFWIMGTIICADSLFAIAEAFGYL